MIRAIFTVLLFAFVAFSLDACVDPSTDIPIESSTCNNFGYCTVGAVDTSLVGCSCFSGYDNCDGAPADVVAAAACSAKRQSATSSNFVTAIGGSIVDGDLQLTISAPIENNVDEDADNYATFTQLRFKSQDHCDYPEGDKTSWAKSFDVTSKCQETYAGTSSFADVIDCMSTTPACYDKTDALVSQCDPDACTKPPCNRCYSGQILATRGYVKTSASGNLQATSTAENCHYFTVCLPWINEVQSDIQVTKIPEFNTSFIVTRVAFSCFENLFKGVCVEDPNNSWLVELESATMYPWYVKKTDGVTSGLQLGDKTFELVKITDVSGCSTNAAVGVLCKQKLQFRIPGCDSLETSGDYNVVGFEYDCVGDCTDAKNKLIADGLLAVSATVTLQATQDNCGADFEIDGTDSVKTDFDAYSSNTFTELNAVFVEGDADYGTAYFKILATSTPAVTGMSLVSLTATVNGATKTITSGATGYVSDVCPVKVGEHSPICFHVKVENLYAPGTLDTNNLVNIALTAKVELSYESGAKRQVGLGSSFDLTNNVRIVPSDSQTTQTGSAAALAISSLAVLAAL